MGGEILAAQLRYARSAQTPIGVQMYMLAILVPGRLESGGHSRSSNAYMQPSSHCEKRKHVSLDGLELFVLLKI